MAQKARRAPHVLHIGLPAQGHLNPAIQFCKRLASKGLRVTLIANNSSTATYVQNQTSSINVELLSDAFKDVPTVESINGEHLEYFKMFVSQCLAEFIEKRLNSEHPPTFLIYDAVMPWALDIARRFGMDGAPFVTHSWAFYAICYHFYKGAFKVPLKEPILSLPSLPPLTARDLPTLLDGTNPALENMVINQFSNIDQAKWIFCNSFDKFEDEVVKWLARLYPVKSIGPTVPSMYLDKRLENDKDYGLNLFKPDTGTCMTGLDSKETGSVVYVSFGSLATMEKEQIEEMAWGLKRSNFYFLWVVRDSEIEKLPSHFSDETSEKGLVVNWSPQLEVLAHKSVGCFLTHCGWNSMLEALSLGVPVVAMPQFADQTTCAKFIEDVWKIGVRVRINEKGVVTKEEIEFCIREVMEGERRKEIRRNSEKWKQLAKEAVDDGGSSDRNIEIFAAELLRS